jgi:hypothetical protein
MTNFRILLFATIVVVTGTANAQHVSWYVDNALAIGNNDGTSWPNAWHSFSAINWGSIKPGDTIYISGGAAASSKTYTTSLTIGASGTSSSPITIAVDASNVSHNGTVILDFASCGASCNSTGVTINQNYVILTGNVGGANHIQINNLRNTTASRNSIGIFGSKNTGVVVDHISFNNDNNPVRFDYANGVTVHDCSITQLIGDAGIAMNASSGTFGNNLIYNNYIEPNFNVSVGGPDGIQGSSGISIYNNTIKEVANAAITTSQQHPDMMQITGNYIKVYGNTFTNAGDSVFDYDCYANSTPHDIWIYNNVFRTIATLASGQEYFRMYCSANSASSINNVKIMNNTFIDNPTDYRLIRFDSFRSNPTAAGNEIKNNIFYNVGGGSTSFPVIHIDNSTGFNSSSFTFNGNIYYQSGQTQYINYRGTSYTAASWIGANEPKGKSGLAPIFKSYTPYANGNDFHLQSTDTVAIDAGVDLSAYFTTDKDGTIRPQGSAWDTGAYEFGAGGPPAAPTGLVISVQ